MNKSVIIAGLIIIAVILSIPVLLVSGIFGTDDTLSDQNTIDSTDPAPPEQNLSRNLLQSLHQFTYDKVTGRWTARNPEQGTIISTDGSGLFRLESGKSSYSISLSGIGRSGNMITPEKGEINIDGINLDYVHEGFTECWINNEESIEHGITILSSPSGRGNLIAEFDVTGELNPSPDRQTIYFSDGGDKIFRYDGLKASDSRGQNLKTTLDLVGNTIYWEIEDKNAVYPVTINPVLTVVKNSDGETAGDCFGYSVSISGEYAIVGAYTADAAGKNSGTAYIYYNKQGGTENWGLVKQITNAAAGDCFGYSVSISGEYAIIGAYNNDTKGTNSGAAYIYYNKKGGPENWGLVKTLNGKAAGDLFGNCVSISDQYAIVGAYKADAAGKDSGTAYIYYNKKGGSENWGLVKQITNAAAEDNFGSSVAVSNEYAIVGAYKADAAGKDSGAAYIYYNKQGGPENWGLVKTLNGKAAGDLFGNCVSISDQYAIVGAYTADAAGKDSGTAYIYYNKQGGPENWGLVKQITNAAEEDNFGSSVAVSNEYAIVGAYTADAAGKDSGTAYIYYNKQGGAENWGLVKQITNAAEEDNFGSSVAVSNEYAIVGACKADAAGKDSGTAYIYYNKQGGPENWGLVKQITRERKVTA